MLWGPRRRGPFFFRAPDTRSLESALPEAAMHTPPAAVLAVLLLVAVPPVFAQFASEQNRREAFRHYRTGQELMTAERFEKAAEEFQLAIDNDRLLTLAHYGLGQAYMELRRF